MTIILRKHYKDGKLVGADVEIKEKTTKELNEWYDFEEAHLAHEQAMQDELDND